MVEMSFLDKMKTILTLMFSSPYFIFLLGFAVIIYFLLKQSTKKNYITENTINPYIYRYFLVLLAIIIKYNKLLSLVDYLIDNLAILFYFPNVATYILIIIIINIIFSNVIGKKMSKTVKI